MEYGLLKGYINRISLDRENNSYIAYAVFPSKLITSYGKDLSMINNLSGSGVIITRNERLIFKLVYPLKSMFDKSQII